MPKDNTLLRDKLRKQKIQALKSENCQGCGREKINSCICLKHNSLFFLGIENKFRKFIAAAVYNAYFDNLILFFIFASTVLLIIENPLDPTDEHSPKAKAVRICNIILTTVFTIEMTMKIITLGLILHKGSYLRSSWNILDIVLVSLGITALLYNLSALKSLRTLRVLRAFRPLRVISRNPGMKIIVETLFASIPIVFNVLTVVLLFFFIFALVGVNFMKGALYYCKGMPALPFIDFSSIPDLNPEQQLLVTYPIGYDKLTSEQKSWFTGRFGVDTVTGLYDSSPSSRTICEAFNTTAVGCEDCNLWVRVQPQNFDNVLNGMMTLFQMTLFEAWTYVMYMFMDSNGIDMQPIRDIGWQWAMFHVFFMLFGAYFCKNLIIGAICDR